MKRLHNSEIWTDGYIKYRKNANGDFEIYVEYPEAEDNWTYSDQDFVENIVDAGEIVAKPVDKSKKE
jgi:hypothetical protein